METLEGMLQSNDQIIADGFENGGLAEAFADWTTDDIVIFKLEMTKRRMIQEMMDAGVDEIIAAAKRLGFIDNLARDIEAKR